MDHKEYLLGLLDGSQSLSHEGIGLVIERLRRLEGVVEVAQRFNPDPHVLQWENREIDLCAALKALEE